MLTAKGPTLEKSGLQPKVTARKSTAVKTEKSTAESTAVKTEKSTIAKPKVTAKEELEVINLSDNLNVSESVSISMSLSAEEIKCLIDLLHEYKDMFA